LRICLDLRGNYMKHFQKISQIIRKNTLALLACLALLCMLGKEPMRYVLHPNLSEQLQASPGEEQEQEKTVLLAQTSEAVMPAVQLSPQQIFFVAFAFEYFTPTKEAALEVRQEAPLMLYPLFKILFREIISPNAP
jgi:hypothetical protein